LKKGGGVASLRHLDRRGKGERKRRGARADFCWLCEERRGRMHSPGKKNTLILFK